MTAVIPRPRLLLAVGLASVVLGTACSSGGPRAASASRATTTAPTSTTTSTSTTSTTTTSVPPTTAKPQVDGLAQGMRGEAVLALQQKLAAQGYDPGAVDGVYGGMTFHAVMAFQKIHGLNRTGRATSDVLSLIDRVGPPPPMLPSGGANRVEVDLKRQVLLLYKGGALLRVLSVSTGNNKRYCVDGECAVAVTPGGSFRVTRKIDGIRVSRLGKLWNPVYFNGGIAIHGSPSVPAYPASHGCVRIPIAISKWFFDTVPRGTPVYVLGGKRAPVPFNEKAPGEESTSTTTTSSSSTTSTSTSTTSTSTTTTTSTSTTSTTSTTLPAG